MTKRGQQILVSDQIARLWRRRIFPHYFEAISKLQQGPQKVERKIGGEWYMASAEELEEFMLRKRSFVVNFSCFHLQFTFSFYFFFLQRA